MKHFLDLADWTAADLQYLLDSAVTLKEEHRRGGNPPLLKGKTLAMVFQKPSLRTRVSFEIAMQQVGGYAFYLSPQEIGLGKRESTADIARVLGGYVDAIMARTFENMILSTILYLIFRERGTPSVTSTPSAMLMNPFSSERASTSSSPVFMAKSKMAFLSLEPEVRDCMVM